MTIAIVDRQYFGNKRVVEISHVATSSTETIATGLKKIDYFNLGIVSASTRSFSVALDVGAAATAITGNLTIKSATVGDRMYIQVYGK